jgi:hypothetical protein
MLLELFPKSLYMVVTYLVTMNEVPGFGLRAYALFYSKHGLKGTFKQSELDWIVGVSMRKKIFATLLNAGWLKKVSKTDYRCVNPQDIFRHLLDFKVPHLIKDANRPYAFTKLSAIEIWSDFSYVQRGRERSPYFIKIEKKDIPYWKKFFNHRDIPNYIEKGSTIGEFIILTPEKKVSGENKEGLFVENLRTTMRYAKNNEMFSYSYNYMKNKYGES